MKEFFESDEALDEELRIQVELTLAVARKKLGSREAAKLEVELREFLKAGADDQQTDK